MVLSESFNEIKRQFFAITKKPFSPGIAGPLVGHDDRCIIALDLAHWPLDQKQPNMPNTMSSTDLFEKSDIVL